MFKGLVYAIIGGVACQSSAQGVSKVNGADSSPQVGIMRLRAQCDVEGGVHYHMCKAMSPSILSFTCWLAVHQVSLDLCRELSSWWATIALGTLCWL